MDLSEKPPRARYSRSSAAMPPITHAAYQTSDEHYKFPRARPQTTETYSPCTFSTISTYLEATAFISTPKCHTNITIVSRSC